MGCSEDFPSKQKMDPCKEGPSPTLTVGHGEHDFMPLLGIDTRVELIHGPQGGFHTNIALQAQYIDPTSSYRLLLEGTVGGDSLGYTVPLVEFDCVEDGTRLESTGSFLIWDAQPEQLHGESAAITATLIDPHRLGKDGSIDGLELASNSVQYIIWDPRLE